MASKFPQSDVADLLCKCHRRCCICHKFCGVKIELDHMTPKEQNGPDTIDNAIAVCFECHAEIHSYNDKHPRGRKFRPDELRKHKEQWLEICGTRPDIFVQATRDSDVGPLQALIDELEFNSFAADFNERTNMGCLFIDEQFRRATHDGAISTLREDLKLVILAAYRAMGRANLLVPKALTTPNTEIFYNTHMTKAEEAISAAKPLIEQAHTQMLKFLGSED
jgi:hypothetical protein